MTTPVAVIDSGVRFDDPNDPDKAKYFDFTDAINEITGVKGEAAVYDDSNGGRDGHGSVVAKIAVQAIKDATAAIIGQQPVIKILPIKVYNSSLNYTSNAEYLKGITDAVDLGAKVINLSRADSFIFASFPNSLITVIQYAQSKGAVVVTAPGNDGKNIDNPTQLDVRYPADLDDPAIVATSPQIANILVASVVDGNRNLYSTSNWGSVHVDFGAPTPGNTQGFTSYSAGYTSGVAGVVAALIQPQLPSGHNLYTDVINDIKGTVIPVTQSVGNWSTTNGPVLAYLSSSGAVIVQSQFGPSDALPLVGDFNGDGKADSAIYVLRSSGIYVFYRNYDGSPVITIHWGSQTNTPVTGDFDGDGVTDLAQSTPGTAIWQEMLSSASQNNHFFAGNALYTGSETPLIAGPFQFGWTDGPTMPLIGPPRKRS